MRRRSWVEYLNERREELRLRKRAYAKKYPVATVRIEKRLREGAERSQQRAKY